MTSLSKMTRAELADWWGISVATLYRHHGKGAPLDHPDKMSAWWERTYKRAAAPWLADGIERWATGTGTEENVTVTESPAPVKLPSVGSLPPDPGQGYSMTDDEWPIDEQLKIARTIVRAYAHKVKQLASHGVIEGDQFAAADRRYQAAAGKLRSLEKDAPKIAIDQGRAWDKAQVTEALIDVGTAMNAALDVFARLVAPQLVGKDVADIAEILESEINRVRAPWSRMQFFE